MKKLRNNSDVLSKKKKCKKSRRITITFSLSPLLNQFLLLMALIWVSSPSPPLPHSLFLQKKPLFSRRLHPSLLSLQKKPLFSRRLHPSLLSVSPPSGSVPLQATGAEGGKDPALLRRPPVGGPPSIAADEEESSDRGGERPGKTRRRHQQKEEDWVDWEDQILEDTVPLVGFVRMLLHSEKYASGDRLSPEHEKTIMERLLPYHPEFEKKIGSGIDFITVGFHPEFESSRCLFIVRKDGEMVDFSYWKCIKGLIKKKYPLYADSFILKHFRRRRQAE